MRKIVIVLLLLVTVLASVKAQSHNITWGKRAPNDHHLQRVVVYKKSKFLQKVTDDYEFNLKPTPYVRAITEVTVTDQYTNGKGGFATLTSGGPPGTSVKIHFTSQRGHGFNFIVDVYGQ